jgi:UDP-N-acetylmuramate dehydrogenase
MKQPSRLRFDVLLAPFTTYKIGGMADQFISTYTQNELQDAVVYAREERIPYFILGTGANILVGDKGFRGLVIHNLASSYDFQDNFLTCETGMTISHLIDLTLEKELSGLEHFIGIPSSVGGALRQNLHFLSPDRNDTLYIGDLFEKGLVLTEKNEIHEVDHDFFQFAYDDSILHHRDIVVLQATFRLTKSNLKDMQKIIESNLSWRRAKQPQLEAFPSCGSVFKKIEDAGAGRLIEKVGLKGIQIGGAMISHQHANYIVNLENATAKDVRLLIALVQEKVSMQTGHKLEPEISFVGEF